MAGRPLTDAPEVEAASRADLRASLAANHGRTSGVWLVTYRCADPDRYLPCDAIVEECLAFGWVDSLPRAKDDLRSMLWIAPRKPGLNRSKANEDRVARREALGLMAGPGRQAVERARADGTSPHHSTPCPRSGPAGTPSPGPSAAARSSAS